MTIKSKNRKCPRCGSNMAHHMSPAERYACGKCGFTEYVKVRQK